MSASATHRPGLGIREKIDLDNKNIEKWGAIPTEEPLSSELKAKIRADLIEAWHFKRETEFRDTLKIPWILPADHYRVVLEDNVGKIIPRNLRYLCNQPTACHWLQSAQLMLSNGERADTDPVTFGAMYEEWRGCYPGNRPDIEYGHFVANPVRITSTGPTTVSGVLEAHQSLCAQASALLPEAQAVAREHPNGGFGSGYYARFEHYSLTPLYPAIVLIIDRVNRSDKELSTGSDGYIRLGKLAQLQTVLLLRTGHEENLSAPISFESLKDRSLPLDRSDTIGQEDDMIRVTLATAVQFITALENREACAKPDTNHDKSIDSTICPPAPKGFEGNDQVRYDPETWADANLVAAEKYRSDNNPGTWESVRRVLARGKEDGKGEDFLQFEQEPFSPKW
ncbi:MAG: hypothetical protein Q9211_002891, partial [Gyalolechia sp. 1 TL-2023]